MKKSEVTNEVVASEKQDYSAAAAIRSLSDELINVKSESVIKQALLDTKSLLKSHGCYGCNAFISYAWEDESSPDGKKANERLQSWLLRISKDLAVVGVNVFLDIEGMKGDLKGWMEESIRDSDYIFIIGTPRYKERATADNTNVFFEFKQIMEKLATARNKSILLPLLYNGDFRSSFPDNVADYLIRDCRKAEDYYHYLLGLVKPLGIIPNVYPQLEKTGIYNQEYSWLYELFSMQLQTIKAQHKSVQDNGLPVVPDNLPSASPFYVGREKEFDILGNNFKSKGRAVVAVQAMGGTGKSQFAAEYANRAKISENVSYDLIRWLKADSVENAKNSYFSFGDDLGIDREDYKDSEDDLIRAIQLQISRYKKILLIYDNVESFEDLENLIPHGTAANAVHVIITTRTKFSDNPTIELNEFTSLEVQSFFTKRLKTNISLEVSGAIGKELGYLPLAVVQSGAFMVKYSKSPDKFLDLLKSEKRQKILDGDPKQVTVSNLWSLTIDRLSKSSLNLVRLCAYLDPDNLPQELLELIAPDDSDEVLYELRSQSLLLDISGNNNIYRIHRLLQEAIKTHLMNQPDGEKIREQILENGIRVLTQLVKSNIGGKSESDIYLYWKARDHLFTQATKLFFEGQSINIQEDLLIELLILQAQYYWLVALDYSKSTQIYDKCLASIYQKDIINNSSYSSLAINILISKGLIYFQEGKYGPSLDAFQKAMTTNKNLPKLDEADILTKIAEVYRAEGNYTDALKNHEIALSIRREAHSNDKFTDIAESLRNLGMVYKVQGNLAKACECLENSLSIRQSIYGKKHPEVAESLNGLGLVYKSNEQYDKALQCFQEALEIRKEIYGEIHFRVAISINCIGTVYDALRQYELALKFYQEALQMRKKIYGENHQSVARTLNGMGNTFKEMGNIKEAKNAFQSALAIQEITYGPNSSRLCDALNGLGDLSALDGSFEVAMEYYKRSLDITKNALSESHPNYAKITKKMVQINQKIQANPMNTGVTGISNSSSQATSNDPVPKANKTRRQTDCRIS